MKEASGELSMTVVTIIAVVAILAIVSSFLLPSIKNYISDTWTNMTDKTTDDYSKIGSSEG
jgi:Tfp pilus assembly protein PilE